MFHQISFKWGKYQTRVLESLYASNKVVGLENIAPRSFYSDLASLGGSGKKLGLMFLVYEICTI